MGHVIWELCGPWLVTGSHVGWNWLWNQEGTGLAGPQGAHLGVEGWGSHGTPMVL